MSILFSEGNRVSVGNFQLAITSWQLQLATAKGFIYFIFLQQRWKFIEEQVQTPTWVRRKNLTAQIPMWGWGKSPLLRALNRVSCTQNYEVRRIHLLESILYLF